MRPKFNSCIGYAKVKKLYLYMMILGTLSVSTFVTFVAAVSSSLDKRKFVHSPNSIGVDLDFPITQEDINVLKPKLFHLTAEAIPQIEIGSIPQLIKLPIIPRIDVNLTQVRVHDPLVIDEAKSSIHIEDGYFDIDLMISQMNATMKISSNLPLVGSQGQALLLARNFRIKAQLGLTYNNKDETISPDVQKLSVQLSKDITVKMKGSRSRHLINAMGKLAKVIPGPFGTLFSLRLKQQAREYGPWIFENAFKASILVPSLMPNRDPDQFHVKFPRPPQISKGKLVLPIAIRGGVATNASPSGSNEEQPIQETSSTTGLSHNSEKDYETPANHPTLMTLTAVDEEDPSPPKTGNTLIDESHDDLWMYGDKPPRRF